MGPRIVYLKASSLKRNLAKLVPERFPETIRSVTTIPVNLPIFRKRDFLSLELEVFMMNFYFGDEPIFPPNQKQKHLPI